VGKAKGREKEIAGIAAKNHNRVPTPLLREFRELENERIQALSNKQNGQLSRTPSKPY
jgi:hypothetical protein